MMMAAALVLMLKAAVVLGNFVAAGVFDVSVAVGEIDSMLAAGEIVVVVGQNVWGELYGGDGSQLRQGCCGKRLGPG